MLQCRRANDVPISDARIYEKSMITYEHGYCAKFLLRFDTTDSFVNLVAKVYASNVQLLPFVGRSLWRSSAAAVIASVHLVSSQSKSSLTKMIMPLIRNAGTDPHTNTCIPASRFSTRTTGITVNRRRRLMNGFPLVRHSGASGQDRSRASIGE